MFEVKIKSRLNTIYGLLEKFMKDQVENPDSICISCLTKWAIADNLKVEMGPIDNETIFTVIDENVTVKKKPYRFE